MGKQSRTNPERAAEPPFAERWGKTARLCAGLGFAACVAIGICGGLTNSARAQTQATTLPLLLPSATAFDAQGNLYFAETGNHLVRKVTPAGVITKVAGNGVQGFAGDNGAATAAELDSPAGIAVDEAGDIFIADSHNQRVREVAAATGVIATIAGTGVAGFSGDGGAATAARLDLPTALALDAAGDVYIADTANHRVRRIAAATGAIATVAGNGVEGYSGDGGAAIAASVDSPNGLALDAAGNLYIADTHNGRVRMVSAATSAITTIAGTGVAGGNVQIFGGDNGAATAAGLALPRGLALDAAGNLYFADSANHRIRRISTAGVITTVAGQGSEAFAGDNAAAAAASLDSPQSVAVSPAGLVTLADSGNQRVRQLDAQAVPDIHTIAGLGGAALGVLSLRGLL
jgi:sugar lactone lactonase YvrE